MIDNGLIHASGIRIVLKGQNDPINIPANGGSVSYLYFTDMDSNPIEPVYEAGGLDTPAGPLSGLKIMLPVGGTVTNVIGTPPITSTGGTTPAIGISPATSLAAGSMSAADKSKLDSLNPGAGLVIAAGALAVGAHADGSIVVNADDVQVGTLATDEQHGELGGGLLHELAVPSGAAGFMSGDWAALVNGATSSLTANALVKRDGSSGVSLASVDRLQNLTFDVGTANPTIAQTQAAAGPGVALTIQAQQGANNQSGGETTLKAGAGAGAGQPGKIVLDLLLSASSTSGEMHWRAAGVTFLAVDHDAGANRTTIDHQSDELAIDSQVAIELSIAGTTKVLVTDTTLGFFGSAGATKPTVTGSRVANPALASLLNALAGLGLITDSTTI